MEQQNWFYRHQEQQVGPVGREEILNLINQGQLDAETYVWAEGMETWQRLGQMPAFAAFLSPAHLPSPPRPTAVTVLGILNIVFGGLSLLCTPLGAVSVFIPQPNSPFQMSAAMKLFALFGACLGFVLAVVLLASGIGLLNLKRWARQAAYVYGWVAVIWGILGFIINGILLSANVANVPQEAMPAVVGGLVGGMCGGLIGLIYPIFLIVYMRKPHVIEACQQ